MAFPWLFLLGWLADGRVVATKGSLRAPDALGEILDLHVLRPKGYVAPAPVTTTPAVKPCPEKILRPPYEEIPKFMPISALLMMMAVFIVLMALIYLWVPWRDDSDDLDQLFVQGMTKSVRFKKKHLGNQESEHHEERSQSDTSEDGESSEEVDSVAKGHSVPWEQYFALAFWIFLLLTNACFTRIVCQYGIPADCDSSTNTVDFVKTLHELVIFGFILAIFTGIAHEARFMWIFRFSAKYPHGIIYMLLFFGTVPVYGWLSDLPSLNSFSLTSTSTFHAANFVILVLLVVTVAALAIWHIWYAYGNSSGLSEGFWAYLIVRMVWVGIYVAYFYCASSLTTVAFHLHHYVVGFLLALLAEFDQWPSLILLAVGTGIMVQGIAAYGADPITHSVDISN